MPQVEKLKIFLASPGDVPKERDYVEQVIAEINRNIAPGKGVTLELVRWERNAFPGYGKDAQALLNDQLTRMEEYELFVGIMWNRIGSKTGRAESGTVEEFERAVAAFKLKGQPEIWFYFRQAAAQLDTQEQLQQRKQVLDFQEKFKGNALSCNYKTPSDFREQFRNQLTLWLNKKLSVARVDPQPPTAVLPPRENQGFNLPKESEVADGQDLPDDAFYVERVPDEDQYYKAILQPGALIRIKAPLQTGKTMLMSKLLNRVALEGGYRKVVLNLRDATSSDFSDLDKFLQQWFCASVAARLGLTHSVDEHWRKTPGNSKIKCRDYFEKYVLPGKSALVLALDKVDRVFTYPIIADDFLGMLRTWHEAATTSPIWCQLRLVVLHTEIYTPRDPNQSPFNAGKEIELIDFTQKEVQDLAQRYEVSWDQVQVQQLMALVGGHPYLVRTALEQVAQHDMTIEKLLETAHLRLGIYRDHFERHWKNLDSDRKLTAVFKEIILADAPVEFNSELDSDTAVKLNDLGLVKLQSNGATPRYELYRQHFRIRLGDT